MTLTLARLGVHHAVDVTDQVGGWSANRLWVGRWRRTNRLVFAKTISPTASPRHRADAAAELANEIAVYRHLDGTGITPTLVAPTSPDDPEGPVLVIEHLDPTQARFAPPLMARPGPHVTTVDQILDLVAKIAKIPACYRDPGLDPPDTARRAYTTHPADGLDDQTLTDLGIDPRRYQDRLSDWAAAAAGWDPHPAGTGHIDIHPDNVAARADGTLIAVDWTDLTAAEPDVAHAFPAVLWSPTAAMTPPGDRWDGPQTIHPLSAAAAAWFLADMLTAVGWTVADRPLAGDVPRQERLTRRRGWIAAACELAACFGLPDLRPPGRPTDRTRQQEADRA